MGDRRFFKLLLAALLTGGLALGGCSSNDGDDGAPGRDGLDAGAAPAAASVETCTVCHGTTVTHEAAERESMTFAVTSAVQSGADVVVTFTGPTGLTSVSIALAKLKADGQWESYITTTKTRSATLPTGWTAWPAGSLASALQATTATAKTSDSTLSEASGTYTATVLGKTLSDLTLVHRVAVYGRNTPQYGTATYDFVPSGDPLPTTAAARRALITDAGCNACHGELRAHGERTDVAFCVTCHNPNGGYDPESGNAIDFTELVHKLHTGHKLASGEYAIVGYGNSLHDYSEVGFPTYMNNCSVCHVTDESLAVVNNGEVSYKLCMSCHDNWDGFDFEDASGNPLMNHSNFTSATNCALCHDGATAPRYVKDFHNGLKTERNGLIWDGKDQSIVLADKAQMAINSIAKDGSNLVIKWKAADATVPADLNPCNSDISAGPVFFGATASASTGLAASNLSVLLAYAQGNDWVNAGIGTSPGQPANAVNVTSSNTVCADNVATTTIPMGTTFGTKGVAALQGKPQVKFAGNGKAIQVRAVSPTREFLVADGSEPAAADKRRQIVDIDKCLKCHPGSVYQHGGNRVDSIELCVMCHNPASSDQNTRVALGVTASEAYDGKAAETYDLRYLLHSIHSAGSTGAPYVIYRGIGVYAWGNDETEGALPNWPGTGAKTVFGSVPAGTNPDGTTKNHNYIPVTYPRAITECDACHVNDSHKAFPDQGEVVGVTFTAGSEPWSNQDDDALMGASAATCMSCHQSDSKSEQSALRTHAYQGGWVPNIFQYGRQGNLDIAK